MIHTTIGVYLDGSKKVNGVTSERLADHIRYNLDFRPGRALFVDGICLHRGGLDSVRCDTLERGVKAITRQIDTSPYV